MIFCDYLRPEVSETGCCFQGGRSQAASPCGDLVLGGQAARAFLIAKPSFALTNGHFRRASQSLTGRACFWFVDPGNAHSFECSPEWLLLCVSLWKRRIRSDWPRRRRRRRQSEVRLGPEPGDVHVTAPWGVFLQTLPMARPHWVLPTQICGAGSH